MNVAEYVRVSEKTLNPESNHLDHFLDGLCTEAGELLNCFKKKWHGKGLDEVNVVEEIGDIAWYVAGIVRYLDRKWILPESSSYEDSPHDVARDIFRVSGLALDHLQRYRMFDEIEDLEETVNYVEEVVEMCTFLLETYDSSWEEAFDTNIFKLQKVRYKDGFSRDATENRDVGAERAVLESSLDISECEEVGEPAEETGSDLFEIVS